MPRVLSRRTTLLAGAATAIGLTTTVTACDVDDLRPPDADAPVAPTPTSPGGSTADEGLVEGATNAITTAMAFVAAGRSLPSLRVSLAPLARDHRRHLAALHAEGSTAAPSTSSASSSSSSSASSASPSSSSSAGRATPTDATAALTAVRTAEQALQEQLVGFAVRAESGTLAALLASMSASIAQHTAVLG